MADLKPGLTSSDIPGPRSLVVAGGGQQAAVRAERHPDHRSVMADLKALHAGGNVPEARRGAAGGGQPTAIGTERHPDHKAVMADLEALRADGDALDPCCADPTGERQPAAIGTERHVSCIKAYIEAHS